MGYLDKFGFLNINSSFRFDGGEVGLLDDFESSRENVENHTHEDGFLYPPLVTRMSVQPVSGEDIEKISKTRKPYLTHKLPPSHYIKLDVNDEITKVRKSDGGFVINLLAYLYGTRLQFQEWWHDGNVPIKSTHNIDVKIDTAEEFISESLKNWREWDEQHKNWLLNILIMNSRASSYEWDWERFSINYMVLDGLYKLVSDRDGGNNRIPHKMRLKLLLDKFDMEYDEDKINDIYELRNDLFHQALWGKGQPCTDRGNAFVAQLNLSKIINRLIPGVLGYKTKYTKSSCLSLAHQRFYSEEQS